MEPNENNKITLTESEPVSDLNISNNIMTNLVKSIQNNDVSNVSKLLSENYISALEYEDEVNKMTILHQAVLCNSTLITLTILQILKSKLTSDKTILKHFINKKCKDAYSAILYAAFRGNIDIIEALIENQADYLDSSLKGLNVLHMAAQGDKPEVLIYFKEKYGMDISQKDFNNSTPLHWACFMGSENSVNFLLTWIDDVNVKEDLGYTPFHLAIFSERIRILKKLYHKGANINEKDIKGRTAFDIAVENNKKNIIEMFNEKNFTRFYTPVFTNKDRNSYFNVIVFIILHIIGQVVVIAGLSSYTASYPTVLHLYYLTQFLIFGSFSYLISSNPGYIIANDNENHPKDSFLDLVLKKVKIEDYCPICIVYLSKDTKHCHYCNKCVLEYDHHCQWIHNCVGKNNSTIFIFFLFIILSNLVLSFFFAYTAIKTSHNENSINIISITTTVHAVDCLAATVIFLAIVFAIPTTYVNLHNNN